MKTLHKRCAGVDVHKMEVVACLRGNHPLKTAGMIGYVCTPGASSAGIPSRRE
jgi:hypothetical protein